MTTITSIDIEDLKQARNLRDVIEELSAFWDEEQMKRQEFYNTITPEDKAEFINGEVIMHSSAREMHNEVTTLLLMLISGFVNHKKLGITRVEKALVSLTRNDYEPDLAFWNNEQLKSINPDTLLYPAPSWVCEVTSISTQKRDRGIKFDDYASHNVLEYWIINPESKLLEQYILVKGVYDLRLKSGEGMVKSSAILGLEIPIAAIFDAQQNIKTLAALLSLKSDL